MKLSIITINLNNRDGLQKTIESVVAQTFKDYEWIVIDGGSTDGSKELIEQYAEYFAYWVSELDKGVYYAMNKGIKVAKGDYLLFLNSGDWLCDKTALERCFKHEFNSDIAYGNVFFCDGAKKVKCCYPEQLSFRYLYNTSLGHSASFIRREIIQKEMYDEELKIVSDWKFFLIQALKDRKFECLGEMVSCFDTHGISSINQDLVSQEREKVIRQLVPESIIADYKQMDEMDARLNKVRMKKVMEFNWRNRLYRKMITVCLRFVDRLERRMV